MEVRHALLPRHRIKAAGHMAQMLARLRRAFTLSKGSTIQRLESHNTKSSRRDTRDAENLRTPPLILRLKLGASFRSLENEEC